MKPQVNLPTDINGMYAHVNGVRYSVACMETITQTFDYSWKLYIPINIENDDRLVFRGIDGERFVFFNPATGKSSKVKSPFGRIATNVTVGSLVHNAEPYRMVPNHIKFANGRWHWSIIVTTSSDDRNTRSKMRH